MRIDISKVRLLPFATHSGIVRMKVKSAYFTIFKKLCFRFNLNSKMEIRPKSPLLGLRISVVHCLHRVINYNGRFQKRVLGREVALVTHQTFYNQWTFRYVVVKKRIWR